MRVGGRDSDSAWIAAFFISFLIVSSPVSATSTLLPRAPAQSVAVADANVALSTGASAQLTNPANLAAADTPSSWQAGILTGRVRATFRRDTNVGIAAGGQYEIEPNYPVIPYAAFAIPLSERVTLGLALDSAFGLTLDWPDRAFNLAGFNADIAHEGELMVLRFGPAVSYKLSPRWSTGVRVFGQYLKAREETDLATVEGDGTTAGYQLGLRYRSEKFAFGASYTSRTKTEIEGDQSNIHPSVTSLVPGPIRADFLLPDRLQAGVAFRLAPTLWWELDADWVGWSYVDRLAIVQANGTLSNAGRDARHYQDGVSIRTGIQWQRGPKATFYAGLAYEPNVVDERDASPLTHPMRKTRYAAGVSQKLDGGLELGLAFQYVHAHTRRLPETVQDNIGGTDTSLYEGTYRSRSYLFAITLGGTF